MSPNPAPGSLPTSFLARRFGSKDARFRSAVTLGFLVAAIGTLAGAPAARRLAADESLWPFASLFGRPAQTAERSFDVAPVPRRTHRAAHRQLWVVPRLAAAQAPLPLGRQSLCVRTCDGYVFPVGTYHGEADRAAHEAACQATCPDAKTALYLMPGGSDRITDAVSLAGGRPYSALPDAFHYTNVLDDACTCHRPGRAPRTLSLLRDMTLRRGDAVMTARGFRVFHGAPRFPYRRSDFLTLARSRDVPKASRPTFTALEKESLRTPMTAGVPLQVSAPRIAAPKGATPGVAAPKAAMREGAPEPGGA